jgi:hypothetical protein
LRIGSRDTEFPQETAFAILFQNCPERQSPYEQPSAINPEASECRAEPSSRPRTGRRCCALELDPGYVDTAIRRWQTLTGDKARHAATGRYFDDLVREVEAANAV